MLKDACISITSDGHVVPWEQSQVNYYPFSVVDIPTHIHFNSLTNQT
jgi:hypothetical protein